MSESDWTVAEGTGWIAIPDFGRINPRQDSVNGGRQYFTAKTLKDEYCKATGEGVITGGPEAFHFEFDQPFFLADFANNVLEVQISPIAGGRYAIKYRDGHWPLGSGGGW